MFTVLLIFHIAISFLLILVILLQSGKGGGLASAFGGAGTSEAVFGGRHAATFLNKATTVLGTIFFISSFGLALLSSHATGPKSVVQDKLQGTPMPVAPAPVTQPVGENLFQPEGAQPAAPGTQAPQPQSETP